jgi:hypothetical protein
MGKGSNPALPTTPLCMPIPVLQAAFFLKQIQAMKSDKLK